MNDYNTDLVAALTGQDYGVGETQIGVNANPYQNTVPSYTPPIKVKDSIWKGLFNPSAYGAYQPVSPIMGGIANINYNNPQSAQAAIGQAFAGFGQGLVGTAIQNSQNESKYSVSLESQQQKALADNAKQDNQNKYKLFEIYTKQGYAAPNVQKAIESNDFTPETLGERIVTNKALGYQYGSSPNGIYDKSSGLVTTPISNTVKAKADSFNTLIKADYDPVNIAKYQTSGNPSDLGVPMKRPDTNKGYEFKVLDSGIGVKLNRNTGDIEQFDPENPGGNKITESGKPVKTLENMPNVKLNEGQSKNVAFFQQSLPAHKTLVELESDPTVFNPASAANRVLLAQSLDTTKDGRPSAIAAVATTALDDNGRKYVAAMRQFAENFGRKQSGGAIGGAELNNFLAQTMPTFGDTPEIIKQKQLYRESILKGYQDASGPATPYIKGTYTTSKEEPIKYPKVEEKPKLSAVTWDYDPADGVLKPKSEFIGQ